MLKPKKVQKMQNNNYIFEHSLKFESNFVLGMLCFRGREKKKMQNSNPNDNMYFDWTIRKITE